jgi:release factor glutamine methyltransferase
VIVSNPPYITVKEKKLMHENVLAFEPHLALFVDNETPLVFYISIANFAIEHLNKGGKLYFEINEYYGVEVKEMLQKKGFKKVNIVKDINDKDRIVSCTI